jgi:hypothetical protein
VCGDSFPAAFVEAGHVDRTVATGSIEVIGGHRSLAAAEVEPFQWIEQTRLGLRRIDDDKRIVRLDRKLQVGATGAFSRLEVRGNHVAEGVVGIGGGRVSPHPQAVPAAIRAEARTPVGAHFPAAA